MLEFNRFWQESLVRLKLPAVSAVSNRKIDSLALIIDMNGVSMSNFNKDFINLLGGVSKQGSNYYPETLKVAYIINAPIFFTVFYGVVKHFYDEDTRRKI